jgi:hAT family C-terminal dimerisation region
MLGDNYQSECRAVLEKFLDGDSLIQAKEELRKIVVFDTPFKVVVDEAKKTLSQHGAGSTLERVVEVQKASLATRLDLIWESELRFAYPNLHQVARRVLSMAVQSADVERVCKAHKVVHTKVRNRLGNRKVNELLYCYVNLRMIMKAGGAESAIDNNNFYSPTFFQQRVLGGEESDSDDEDL